jgi:hypothetical protein
MSKRQLLLATLFCLLFSLASFAQFKQSPAKKNQTQTTKKLGDGGGTDISGEIDGAPYRIAVPEVWNGTLIIYGHGYRDRADHPGEVDNRTADIAPDPALEPFLLGQGYALAGSAFKNNGWAVEEGYVDSLNLVAFFKSNVANPNRVLYWGFSMGSVIGFKSAEKTTVYDGIMCGCGVGAGAPASFDASADLLVAYDTVFGMPMAWGNPGDVRDDLDFDTEVLSKLGLELSNPSNFPGFEFMRLVVGTPGRGITPPPPPDFYPGWAATDMFFATEVRAELERRANGPVVQNLNRNYELTVGERAYLNGLGVTNAQIDAWLTVMNNSRVHNAPAASRNYLINNSVYNGKIRSPVLTMHTIIDPLVTVTQQNAYSQTAAQAGRLNQHTRIRNSPSGGANPRDLVTHSQLLYQTYTNANGHCNFTGEQLITAITTLDNWVATKTRPSTANFPEVFGFDNAFTPPPLNQP